MYLDVRTMVIILGLAALLSSGGMALLGRRFSSKVGGSRRFSLGLLLFVLGWGLLGLREIVPNFLSIMVSNTILVYAVGVFYQAIRRFQKQEYNNYLIYTMTALTAISMSYFYYMDNNILVRTVLVSVIVSVLLLSSVRALLHEQPLPLPTSHWMVAAGFGLLR